MFDISKCLFFMIFICLCGCELIFVPAAFSLITAKSLLGRRQPPSVCVGCLPTTHAHTISSVRVWAQGTITSNEVMDPDKCPSPRSQGLHGHSALISFTLLWVLLVELSKKSQNGKYHIVNEKGCSFFFLFMLSQPSYLRTSGYNQIRKWKKKKVFSF